MERDRRISWSWWVGAIVIVLTLPAVVAFIERDGLNEPTSSGTNAVSASIPPSEAGPGGVVEVGDGTCVVTSEAIRIEGPGMTVCRANEWAATPYLDQQVSVDAVGIDAGATIVFRFRESENRRVEVAVGRTAVVIREKAGDTWTLLTSVPRQGPTDDSIPMTTSPTAAVHRLKIDLSGETVSVVIDGTEVARGLTSIGDSGLFSLGAITSETVAVRLYSISVTDAG